MSQPKQTVIESLKEIKNNGFSTGTILEPKIEFIPKYVWNLIDAAIAESFEAARETKKEPARNSFTGRECETDTLRKKYESFEDWQEKEGTKI